MTYRDDRGLTLTELLVVLALLGIVLTIAFTGMRVAERSNAVSQEKAIMADEIAGPMQILDKVLSQNITIDDGSIGGTQAPSGYYMSVITDRDNDGSLERHIFEATAAGASGTGELRYTVYSVDTSRQNVALVHQAVWSDASLNQPTNTPVFTYYRNADREVVTDMGLVPKDAKLVDVTLMSRFQARQSQPAITVRDTRTIFFLNRGV
jgi:prepilin-type N-terminal cleavage/methylation domain-containing protein